MISRAAEPDRGNVDPCRHLNVCQAPAAPAVPADADALAFWRFAEVRVKLIATPDVILPPPSPYLLPYSQAPPTPF